MTELKKPVRRVSGDSVFEAGKLRPVIITLEPPCVLKFRAKGCKKTYSLTIAACYSMAVKADIEAKKREKQKQPKQSKRKIGLSKSFDSRFYQTQIIAL